MTDKLKCETCKLEVDSLNEADQCEECSDKWFAEEIAYWKPLYDGEVLAGLHTPKEPTP